jgi:hypothetical protein
MIFRPRQRRSNAAAGIVTDRRWFVAARECR